MDKLKAYFRKIKLYYIYAKERHDHWGHKQPFVQFYEMILVYFATGIFPGYYLQANMGARRYSYYKFGFMNQKSYIKLVYRINDRLYHRTSMNKMVEKAIFTSYGLPTPKLLGYYNSKRGRDTHNNPLTDNFTLKMFLRNLDNERLCIKPASSFGGKGVKIVDIIRTSNDIFLYDRLTKETAAVEKWVADYFDKIDPSDSGGFVIEEFLKQHPVFARFNESSVNTVRVMVNLRLTNADPVFGAFLRVGRSGAVVDNGTSGGIMVKIFPESGELGYGCFSRLSNDRFECHPDSHARFKGERLPYWNDIKSLAVEVVKLFPGIDYAGLDIALSEKGPVVIEMNVQPDYVDFALIEIPAKKVIF